MKPEIEAIIFDLGGVILEVDYQRTVDAFKALGINDFDFLYSKKSQSEVFDQLETGKISAEQFRSWVRTVLPNATDTQIDRAWNAIILDFPKGRLEYLEGIKAKKRCFLLSNTNEIHSRFFNQLVTEKYSKEGIYYYFDKAYLSHEIGIRKPDPAAFLLIMNEQMLRPEKTLFVDDSEQHIESAKQLGIQTILLNSINQLEFELSPFLA